MSEAPATLRCGRQHSAGGAVSEVMQLSIAHIGIAEPIDDGEARRGERTPRTTCSPSRARSAA